MKTRRFIRRQVPIDSDIELKPLEKIINAIVYYKLNSEFSEQNKLEEQRRERMKFQNTVKAVKKLILEAIDEKLFRERNQKVHIVFDVKYSSHVVKVIASKEMKDYDISVRKPNHNVEQSFDNIPIYLIIGRRVL